MLNVTQPNTPPDIDQNHYLNGMGSVVIIPAKNRKTSSKSRLTQIRNRLINHLKNHLTVYLILLALAATALVVLHIQKDYQYTLDQTLAQNKQLKQIIEEVGKASKSGDSQDDNKVIDSSIVNGNNGMGQASQLKPFVESTKVKQSAAKVSQYNEISNKIENLNPIPQQLMPQKFKPNTPAQVINLPTKTNKQIEKSVNKDTTKIIENKQNIQSKQTPKGPPLPPLPSNQPAPKQAPKQPANVPTQAGRPIAGITQDQRTKAQRWLTLKNENIYENTELAEQERKYYEKKYNMSSYAQLPVCIVIPSHNNVKDNLHIKNIKSIIMQEYTNYHIVFIDDASTDGTGDQIEHFLANQTKVTSDRYVVIKNKEQKRAMPNLRRAAKQFCKHQDIFIIVDGDDQLLGRQVLKLFSAVFQINKAWFVYSNFLSIRGTVGYSRPFPQATIKGNKYRSYPFVTSHLRAFYTQLFININENDLKDDAGQYLKAANDVAICIPILEQSHQRVVYLPELTYYYNSNTGQNNHQVRLKQQKSNDRMLRKRKSYARLKQLEFTPKLEYKTAETIQILAIKQAGKEKSKTEGQAGKNSQ